MHRTIKLAKPYKILVKLDRVRVSGILIRVVYAVIGEALGVMVGSMNGIAARWPRSETSVGTWHCHAPGRTACDIKRKR